MKRRWKLMATGKKWVLFTACALLWVAWFPVLEYHIVSNSPPMRRGPGSGVVSTSGVFEPGGYIRFQVNPDLRSVEGYYHATVVIEPMAGEIMTATEAAPNENASPVSSQFQVVIEPEIVWATLQQELNRGWPWGDSISSLAHISSEEINFDILVDIPDDPALSGERIRIAFLVDIDYPVFVGLMQFDDASKRIDETIQILVGGEAGEAVSAWENFWNRRPTDADICGFLIWVSGAVALMAAYGKLKGEW